MSGFADLANSSAQRAKNFSNRDGALEGMENARLILSDDRA
jgi:hypothetical protein